MFVSHRRALATKVSFTRNGAASGPLLDPSTQACLNRRSRKGGPKHFGISKQLHGTHTSEVRNPWGQAGPAPTTTLNVLCSRDCVGAQEPYILDYPEVLCGCAPVSLTRENVLVSLGEGGALLCVREGCAPPYHCDGRQSPSTKSTTPAKGYSLTLRQYQLFFFYYPGVISVPERLQLAHSSRTVLWQEWAQLLRKKERWPWVGDRLSAPTTMSTLDTLINSCFTHRDKWAQRSRQYWRW